MDQAYFSETAQSVLFRVPFGGAFAGGEMIAPGTLLTILDPVRLPRAASTASEHTTSAKPTERPIELASLQIIGTGIRYTQTTAGEMISRIGTMRLVGTNGETGSSLAEYMPSYSGVGYTKAEHSKHTKQQLLYIFIDGYQEPRLSHLPGLPLQQAASWLSNQDLRRLAEPHTSRVMSEDEYMSEGFDTLLQSVNCWAGYQFEGHKEEYLKNSQWAERSRRQAFKECSAAASLQGREPTSLELDQMMDHLVRRRYWKERSEGPKFPAEEFLLSLAVDDDAREMLNVTLFGAVPEERRQLKTISQTIMSSMTAAQRDRTNDAILDYNRRGDIFKATRRLEQLALSQLVNQQAGSFPSAVSDPTLDELIKSESGLGGIAGAIMARAQMACTEGQADLADGSALMVRPAIILSDPNGGPGMCITQISGSAENDDLGMAYKGDVHFWREV